MNISEDKERRDETRLYTVGFALALALSAIPFACVGFGLAPRETLIWVIAIFAFLQVIVHFRCFLHIDLSKSHRDDLQLILFSVCIVLLMAGGTLWVIGNQEHMMSMPSLQ